MLRAAARSTVRQSGKRLQGTAPPTPSTPAPKKSGGGGLFKAALFTTVAGAGGTVAYAYADPEFRHKVEDLIPPSKDVFETILGSSSLDKTKASLEATKDKIVNAIPKKKVDAPLQPLPLEALPPIAKKPPVHVDAVDITPPSLVKKDLSEEQIKKSNSQLESRLISAIASAESKVQTTLAAKMDTIKAVNDHAALLRKTVDDGSNADWNAVTAALSVTETAAKKDADAEMDGKNYIDNLSKIISDGKASSATKSNPLLLNAQETANKLANQLDELNILVERSRKEARVFTEYKELVDQSRKQFEQELKGVVPGVDINAKDRKLTEYEQDALIAHAHLRVDQLRKQIADLRTREETNILRAVEMQKQADDEASTQRLELETRRLKQHASQQIEKELATTRSSWEGEMEEKLVRATKAHAEHLDSVIRTQRQLFDVEKNQRVEEAVHQERELHSRHVGAALSRLEGIETALGGRVALDAENRRSKQFWLACHHLIECIVNGKRAGKDMEERRSPLSEQLQTLKQVNGEDSFVNNVVDLFPRQAVESGCYTKEDIKNRFDKLYRQGRKTAMIDSNGGTVGKYLWSNIRSLFLLDLPRKFSYDDKFDINSLDNLEALARAKWFVEKDDFESAAKMVNLLDGQPAQIAKDWVRDVRMHMETKFLAELLVAHAAVQSIRSTY